MQRKTVSLLVALLMLSAVPLNASADENDDIPTNASSTGVHDSLVAALAHADLVSTLQGDGPFTVFAPTDDAFAAAGIDLTTFDTDEENATLTDILLYHVYSGAVNAADVTDGLTVTMVNGDEASFTVTDDAVMIGDATVTTADVQSSNGVIHVIDKVLMPPADLVDIPTVASDTGVHTALVAALSKADLVTTLQGVGPFTVFAPTDQAFTDAGIDLDSFTTDEDIAALADILTYHVLAGSVLSSDIEDKTTATAVNGDSLAFAVSADGVMVNDANVVAADVLASNGVVHVIDKVLMPPADELADIPTVAVRTGVHTALVDALTQADLVTTLQGDGPFTVFAPTDQAFTDAGIDLDSFSTDEEIAALADILLFHVYSGAVNAADVTDGLTVTMVNGDEASFTVSTDGTVMIGDATVTQADVAASNGIIHVIDKVLMPPTETVPDIPTTASGTGVHTALVAAVVQAGLLETLQGEGPFTLFAPTDEAFETAGIDLSDFETEEGLATLADILLYHVASGAVTSDQLSDGMVVTMVNQDGVTFTVNSDGVMVNDATVTMADVAASNGVIHVIDKVLMPPAAELADIPTVASETGIHTALVAALIKADLVSTLQNDGPFTVFAPTDQAFTDAGIDLDSFTTDEEIATLADILLYHVVAGEIMSTDLADGKSNVTTANGDLLLIQVSDVLGVMVGAELGMVTSADVPASNGVIHVIDRVLMPPADQLEEEDVSGDNCDLTIGISSDGYAFSPASVTIDVGQTVCWKWTDESMAHNVKQVDGMKSDTFVDGGITSGEAANTVDFQMTFTDDTTFYYACEPHVSVDMFGKIVVGDGGSDSSSDDDDDDSDNNTPGFLGVTMLLATLGAVAFARSNREEE